MLNFGGVPSFLDHVGKWHIYSNSWFPLYQAQFFRQNSPWSEAKQSFSPGLGVLGQHSRLVARVLRDFFRNAGCPELSSATRWRGSWSEKTSHGWCILTTKCGTTSRVLNFMIWWEYDDIKINNKVAYGKKTTAVETQTIYDLGGWMAWSQACLLSIWSWNPIELYQTVQHMTKNVT